MLDTITATRWNDMDAEQRRAAVTTGKSRGDSFAEIARRLHATSGQIHGWVDRHMDRRTLAVGKVHDGFAWTPAADAVLRKRVELGHADPAIAQALGVGKKTVTKRRIKLGLASPYLKGRTPSPRPRSKSQGGITTNLIHRLQRKATTVPLAAGKEPVGPELVRFRERVFGRECSWISAHPKDHPRDELMCCGRATYPFRQYCADHLRASLTDGGWADFLKREGRVAA